MSYSFCRKTGIYLLLLCFCVGLTAQPISNPWRKSQHSEIESMEQRWIQAQEESIFYLDVQQLQQILAQAPMEFTSQAFQVAVPLTIPMPDGSLQMFSIVQSPVAEAGLLQKYPGIQTYAGKGIDDPRASIRLDLTPSGFHAMILSTSGTVFIDPFAKGNTAYYTSYFKKDFQALNKQFVCEFEDKSLPEDPTHPLGRAFGDCQFRTYRLALAATGEYTAFHGGKPQAIAAQITTMNRVNGVMERDLGIRLVIIPNNDTLVYTNASTDPYTNGNAFVMLSQNQNNITAVIGSANYDIGHVFGVGSGGVASLGSLCSTNQKARGVTGTQNPVGDPFDIDYVAHEIGHQLGGRHTFNGTAGSCGGNLSTVASFEPGSGSTIMAYAGICGSQNVQSNSDDHYHAYSLEEMLLEIVNSSCGTIVPSVNSAPVISGSSFSHVIPASTPFFLEISATDPDGDSLTYCWEQFDNDLSTQPPVATSTVGPNFRSFSPTPDPRRYFPRLNHVINGTSSPWEVLPSVSRNMDFIVTVRDNSLPGCTDSQEGTVTIAGNAGPFLVLHPDTAGISFPGLSSQQVTWDVASTDLPPVSCANVDILLSVDGGLTFPITLASSVPNTGTHPVTIPDTATTEARIMIRCTGGVFFDISNEDFTIIKNTGPNFFMTINSQTSQLCAPDSGEFSLLVGGVFGFQGTVSLTASISPPSAMSAIFDNAFLQPGDSTSIFIQNTNQVAPGLYTLTIDGNSSTLQNQTSISFEVLSGAPSSASLVFPPAGMLGVAQFPVFDWQTVPFANTYTLEVASDSLFTSPVAIQAGLDTPLVGLPFPLAPSTFYFWRVISENPCGTSVSPVQFFFTKENSCQTDTSTDVPKTIASAVPNVVNSTLSFPFQGTITDVKVVDLTGNHTWVNDLTIKLESPSGTSVVLMDQICGNENNFDIEFSDAGIPHLGIPCPPTDGMTYQPEDPLSAFFGENPQGTWTLIVEDAAQQDGGSLQSWGLEICFNSQSTCNLSLNTSITQISCQGNCDGELSGLSTTGTGPFQFFWSTGQTDSTLTSLCEGNYILVMQDTAGCLGSEVIQLMDPPNIDVVTTTTDASCAGIPDGSVSFAISGGIGPYSIDLGGFDSTSLGAGQYSAIVTDAVGCSESISFTIVDPPSISIDFGPDATACEGESVVLDASGLGQGFTYLWSTGEMTSSIVVTDSGEYWLLASDANNCTGGDTIVLDFLESAMADFSYNRTAGVVDFLNTSTPGSYFWDFGDGSTSMDPSPTHTYGDTGMYTVRLIVDPGLGCPFDTIFQQIEIFPSTSMDVFGEGKIQVYPNPASDILTIELSDVLFSETEALLYNQLGQLVLQKQFTLTAGRHKEELSLNILAEGIYHLHLTAEGATVFSKRIIISQ